MKPECFFAKIEGSGPCDGHLVRCHLVAQQTLRAEFGKTLGNKLAKDPATWVSGCGGPTGLAGHHGAFDTARTLRVPRAALPLEFEAWCASLGLGWYVDREYGPVEAAA